MKTINIVIPFYNEASNLHDFISYLEENLNFAEYDFIISLIDDGSSDKTWVEIEKLQNSNVKYRKIKLSRNFGNQGAIFAGLELFNEDAAIILDGDFQDDPKYIPQMIELWNLGNDIVLANRIKRKENFLRKFMVSIYYRLQNKLSDISIPKNVGNFSLMDKKIVHQLVNFRESKKFIIGLRSYVGFNTIQLDVVRNKRKYGHSKTDLKKLLQLSTDGLIGFSTAPLNLIFVIGIFISVSSILFSLYALCVKVVSGNTLLVWNFSLVSIYFLSGVQLLSLSILGQYIAKIFEETKDRPQFIIEKTLED